MNKANITGLNYSVSISPDNGWMNYTENNTYIICTGIVIDNAHAVEYTLTITATNQTTDAIVDIVTAKFNISENNPPTIDSLDSRIVTINTCETWSLASNAIQDEENDPFTTSILINGSATIPSWLSYEPSNYTFNACGESQYVNFYTITLVVNDGYNLVEEQFDIIIVNDNYPNEISKIDDYIITTNHYFEIQLPSVNELFPEGTNGTIIPYLHSSVNSPFPNFLIFDSAKNSMHGIASHTDINEYSMILIGNNHNDYIGAMRFNLTIRMCYKG